MTKRWRRESIDNYVHLMMVVIVVIVVVVEDC